MQKATPRRARLHNTQLVLKTIYSQGLISRAQIARATKLTRPSVSEVVAGLLSEGLIEEVGYAPSSGGRRAVLLRIIDDSRHIIGLDLSRDDFRGAVINLRGEVKHRAELPLKGRDGEAALELVYTLIDALMTLASSPALGIGVGAPGLVDAVNGVMHQSVNLNWRDIPLGNLLHERYQVPVYMANDCQAAAFAEYTFGVERESMNDLVVIASGRGVGAGIVLRGQLLHGNPLGAGEIGHVRVIENGDQCACGNYGCLETVASIRSIVLQARQIAQHESSSYLYRYANDLDAITLEKICEAIDAEDEHANQIVQNVGHSIGVAVASLVGVLGSCRILLSGGIACLGPDLLNIIRAEMNERTLPSLTSKTEIGFASLGSDIVMLGASAFLLQHELGVL